MTTKEQLIAQGTWDPLKDRPYENRTVQAAQHSTFQRSVQALGDLEEDRGSQRQTEAGCSSQGCGSTCGRCQNALQVMKEAFCVVEDLVKYLERHGHHTSHAHAKGKQYLNNLRPLIS
jgi:hypothetical protein